MNMKRVNKGICIAILAILGIAGTAIASEAASEIHYSIKIGFNNGVFGFGDVVKYEADSINAFRVNSYDEFKQRTKVISTLNGNIGEIRINPGETVGWVELSDLPMILQIDSIRYSCALKGYPTQVWQQYQYCYYKFTEEGIYNAYVKQYPDKYQTIVVGNPVTIQTPVSTPPEFTGKDGYKIRAGCGIIPMYTPGYMNSDYNYVKSVKDLHENELMSNPGVTGVGITEADTTGLGYGYQIAVYLRDESSSSKIPCSIDNVQVVYKVTGEIIADNPVVTSTPLSISTYSPTSNPTPVVTNSPVSTYNPSLEPTPCKKWDGVEWVDCQTPEAFNQGQNVMRTAGQFIHGAFNQLLRGLNGWIEG